VPQLMSLVLQCDPFLDDEPPSKCQKKFNKSNLPPIRESSVIIRVLWNGGIVKINYRLVGIRNTFL